MCPLVSVLTAEIETYSSKGLGEELVKVPYWRPGGGLGENARDKGKACGLVGHWPARHQ